MRYELRRWTNPEQTEYVLKATSDDEEVLRAYIDRPSVPNTDWYNYHIVDTENA